ncbi:hypothetical protein VNO80_29222 [Phaseolus coccineus]|uniref:Uncharacterized protein n=1 Tax=Phaseolus coccineus TaxID=3886 RepID=A0AAN9LAI8_PHACN
METLSYGLSVFSFYYAYTHMPSLIRIDQKPTSCVLENLAVKAAHGKLDLGVLCSSYLTFLSSIYFNE